MLITAHTYADVLASVSDVLRGWDNDQFVKLLPRLRLALAELTPQETDRVAKQVAALFGAEVLNVTYLPDLSSEEMLRAVEVNGLVHDVLAADGLQRWGKGNDECRNT